MATTTELLNRMETLIKELGNTQTGSCTCKSSISPVKDPRDIIVDKTLSYTQRLILLFMSKSNKETKQNVLVDSLGMSMKCARENCEGLMEVGYLKRGTRASTWVLA